MSRATLLLLALASVITITDSTLGSQSRDFSGKVKGAPGRGKSKKCDNSLLTPAQVHATTAADCSDGGGGTCNGNCKPVFTRTCSCRSAGGAKKTAKKRPRKKTAKKKKPAPAAKRRPPAPKRRAPKRRAGSKPQPKRQPKRKAKKKPKRRAKVKAKAKARGRREL